MSNIIKYRNGNYDVVFDLNNGTKIRCNNENEFTPEFPESMDIKITNCCNGVNGKVCEFCHEKSTPYGEHGDIMAAKFIDTLHPYTELAIGGGNVLTHPDLISFLNKCKKLKLIPSITVHQEHFMDNVDMLKELCDNNMIYGLGVSLSGEINEDDDVMNEFIYQINKFPNAVVHVINGIVSMYEFSMMAYNDLKILILGYKQFGRGFDYYNSNHEHIENNKSDLYESLPEIIRDGWFEVISFDNLAIKQLDVKRLMNDDEWLKFYMGNDGAYTMYVDCVKKQFAKSSTSTQRYDLMGNIVDMFNVIRNEGK